MPEPMPPPETLRNEELYEESSPPSSDSSHVEEVGPPRTTVFKPAPTASSATAPSRLLVHEPSSRFAHPQALINVPDDLIDLFDDSDDSDEDRKRTLIELVVKNKRRRRRLLRKVKHLKMSLTNERVHNKAKQTH